MKPAIKPLQPVSLADGQAIPGRDYSVIRQWAIEPVHNRSLSNLRRQNLLTATSGAHQSAALFHAMRLTSGDLALQSP